jgi:DNA-directed RNA polymerase specialized sigma24 family protein
MEEKALLKEIIYKLDKVISLLALNNVLNKKQGEQIAFLSNVGFQPKEIANILGTTANTVRVALTHIRKKSKR